jgi:hypothetical protein
MAQQSPLLLLPGELKNQIVEYIFHHEPGTAPPPLRHSPLSLSSTCRQLYEEYRTLAWTTTIFTLSWSSADDLMRKTSLLRPTSPSSITKLQIKLPQDLTDLYTADANRRRLKPFAFSRAGLTNLSELYIRYLPSHTEKGIGGPGRELIVQFLWRIMWERDSKRLRKICIVHDGAQPFLSLSLLCNMLQNFTPLQVSKRWSVRSDLEHGRLRFEEWGGGDGGRGVDVFVGFSFWEAERYVDVCEDVLEVCLCEYGDLCAGTCCGVLDQSYVENCGYGRGADVDFGVGKACSDHFGSAHRVRVCHSDTGYDGRRTEARGRQSQHFVSCVRRRGLCSPTTRRASTCPVCGGRPRMKSRNGRLL